MYGVALLTACNVCVWKIEKGRKGWRQSLVMCSLWLTQDLYNSSKLELNGFTISVTRTFLLFNEVGGEHRRVKSIYIYARAEIAQRTNLNSPYSWNMDTNLHCTITNFTFSERTHRRKASSTLGFRKTYSSTYDQQNKE